MIGVWERIDLITFNSAELVLYYKKINTISNLIYKVKQFFRDIKPKRRLYPNGSIYHFTYGQPTLSDYFNKWLCDNIFDRPKNYFIDNTNSSRFRAVIEFFDYSVGKYVDMKSYSYKENLKRRGRVLMSEQEAEQEARKNRAYIEQKTNEKYDKAYEQHISSYLRSKGATPNDLVRAIAKNSNKN
jgi:hypothetical protein